MLVIAKGIVIGKRDIGESHCFLDILTDEYGVIEATAHGVKKPGNKNASSSGLFSYSKFCFNKNRYRYSINSVEPIYSFFGLSSDLKKFSLAAYFSDIIKYTSTSEQNSEDILRFFTLTLYKLEKENADCDIIKSAFELRIAAMLGFLPDLRACRGCGRYINGQMYFSFEHGDLICEECSKNEENRVMGEKLKALLPDLLYTMRFVIYSPTEKVHSFMLKGKTKEEFKKLSVEYLLGHLGRDFDTLKYYENIL